MWGLAEVRWSKRKKLRAHMIIAFDGNL